MLSKLEHASREALKESPDDFIARTGIDEAQLARYAEFSKTDPNVAGSFIHMGYYLRKLEEEKSCQSE